MRDARYTHDTPFAIDEPCFYGRLPGVIAKVRNDKRTSTDKIEQRVYVKFDGPGGGSDWFWADVIRRPDQRDASLDELDAYRAALGLR